MPFKKQGPDDYTGPSGRHFNLNQVRRYYAKGGHFQDGGEVNQPLAREEADYDAAQQLKRRIIGNAAQATAAQNAIGAELRAKSTAQKIAPPYTGKDPYEMSPNELREYLNKKGN